jgi:hypothetical protein
VGTACWGKVAPVRTQNRIFFSIRCHRVTPTRASESSFGGSVLKGVPDAYPPKNLRKDECVPEVAPTNAIRQMF